jgi:hypothetical protein
VGSWGEAVVVVGLVVNVKGIDGPRSGVVLSHGREYML